MGDEEWGTHFVKTLGVLLSGEAHDIRDWHGQTVRDDTFVMLLNASHDPVDFTLPDYDAKRWERVLDTGDERGFLEVPTEHAAGEKLPLPSRSFLLLRRLS